MPHNPKYISNKLLGPDCLSVRLKISEVNFFEFHSDLLPNMLGMDVPYLSFIHIGNLFRSHTDENYSRENEEIINGYDLSAINNGGVFRAVENSIIEKQTDADDKIHQDFDEPRAKRFGSIIPPVFFQISFLNRAVFLDESFDGGTEAVASDDVVDNFSEQKIYHQNDDNKKTTDSDGTTCLDQLS
ncbi:hypothetical protein K435DRAFT_812767 [Dendrothele bispora CBS 962.96]|uniref:Uncharacterized protein n=1 Tax=Dendrothele bispora (strain CBS 962.96) TaxID=1314807 RepID=A0A4S8KNF4_DENBC|nr:hypothetical protein K435DRAFT_812767 [Dendrothele bispora CBS 962.96]